MEQAKVEASELDAANYLEMAFSLVSLKAASFVLRMVLLQVIGMESGNEMVQHLVWKAETVSALLAEKVVAS